MTRQELYTLAHNHCLTHLDIEDAIEFVSDLLDDIADEIQRDEPYAIKTINELRNAATQVFDLTNYVAEIEE